MLNDRFMEGMHSLNFMRLHCFVAIVVVCVVSAQSVIEMCYLLHKGRSYLERQKSVYSSLEGLYVAVEASSLICITECTNTQIHIFKYEE